MSVLITYYESKLEVKARESETVLDLKARLCGLLDLREADDVARVHMELLESGEALQDHTMLRALGGLTVAGYAAPKELKAELVDGAPAWAKDLGLDAFHCQWLRHHYARYGLDRPTLLSDTAQIWEALRADQEARLKRSKQLQGWGHWLYLERDGKARNVLRGPPGAEIQVVVKGWVWNNNNSDRRHQLGLAVGPLQDENLVRVMEVYDNVPDRTERVSRHITVTLPDEPGAHLLYSWSNLQRSFAVALRYFLMQQTTMSSEYPQDFVGWVVVETPMP